MPVRQVEDAVVQALRRELEPHGFRYKARKLVRQAGQWRMRVFLFRARWIKPDEEIFDILTEIDVDCPAGVGEPGYGTVLSLVKVTRGGLFYGESQSGACAPVAPEAVVDEFRSTILPVILEIDSPAEFAEALLRSELAPGVPNWFDSLERAREAYRLSRCLGIDDVTSRAIDLLKQISANPSEREAAQFMWQSLQIPGALAP